LYTYYGKVMLCQEALVILLELSDEQHLLRPWLF